jgi:hypothetical protein
MSLTLTQPGAQVFRASKVYITFLTREDNRKEMRKGIVRRALSNPGLSFFDGQRSLDLRIRFQIFGRLAVIE